MHKVLFVLSVFVVFGLSGCSAKKCQSDNYYERANKASSESLKGLDKE